MFGARYLSEDHLIGFDKYKVSSITYLIDSMKVSDVRENRPILFLSSDDMDWFELDMSAVIINYFTTMLYSGEISLRLVGNTSSHPFDDL